MSIDIDESEFDLMDDAEIGITLKDKINQLNKNSSFSKKQKLVKNNKIKMIGRSNKIE